MLPRVAENKSRDTARGSATETSSDDIFKCSVARDEVERVLLDALMALSRQALTTCNDAMVSVSDVDATRKCIGVGARKKGRAKKLDGCEKSGQQGSRFPFLCKKSAPSFFLGCCCMVTLVAVLAFAFQQ